MRQPSRSPSVLLLATASGLALIGLGAATALLPAKLPGVTPADLEQPGTQPFGLNSAILPAAACTNCHAGFDESTEPHERWSASMMAQSARDPIFWAALTIAEQDAAPVGELCLRCHAPSAWLEGRGTPSNGSALAGPDFDGVNCNMCHRMVDPIADPANPSVDASILASLAAVPTDPHTGQYVVDPEDRRRGPFDLGPFFFWHSWEQSPYHQESLLCGTCHDVSNPLFDRVGGAAPAPSDTYALNAMNTPANSSKYDQFPLERTYSEWAQSSFASGGVDMGGLFGGNKQVVSSCQDCHMEDTSGEACAPGFGAEHRDDLPQHNFNGANSWVIHAVRDLDADPNNPIYGAGEESGVTEAQADAAVARNVSMLQRASDVVLTQQADQLQVRIYNNSGHKLPTGYGEGRRMWIQVRFLGPQGQLIEERGGYDPLTATLDETGTKVYEVIHGLDATVASATGLDAGKSFHFALNNVIEKDNRIPPRGFTNAGFEAVQAHPVGASYADGEYWDDTLFAIPCEAVSAEVRVLHQTTTKEYIEFLRDENTTDTLGQLAYDLWVANGMSAPVEMDLETIDLGPRLTGDVTTISYTTGGTQVLTMEAPACVGLFHVLVGSITGTAPGLVFDGYTLPLNFDAYLNFTLTHPNSGVLPGSFGLIPASGTAAASFQVPAGVITAPLTFHHAFAVFDGAKVVGTSNPAQVDLVP